MNNEYWDWSQRYIFYIWDQINLVLRWVIIWDQTSKIAPWDWSHKAISDNLGIEVGDYLIPDIKKGSLGLVP